MSTKFSEVCGGKESPAHQLFGLRWRPSEEGWYYRLWSNVPISGWTMGRARMWGLWLLGTLSTLPVSYLVWWFWGMSFCGEEVYDTPPGSTGDALCGALIEPVWPWALVASIPTLLALVGGFFGLLLRDARVFYFSLLAPVALGVLTVFLAPALF